MKEKTLNLSPGEVPIHSITSVSKMLKIHSRTLMKYEKLGLINPFRDSKNNRRLYSNNDIKWITCIAKLVHENGFSLKSLNHVLSLVPCWILNRCPEESIKECEAYYKRPKPIREASTNTLKLSINKISCTDCVFFQASKQKKDIIVSSIETILSD